jgi:hypothetical protein
MEGSTLRSTRRFGRNIYKPKAIANRIQFSGKISFYEQSANVYENKGTVAFCHTEMQFSRPFFSRIAAFERHSVAECTKCDELSRVLPNAAGSPPGFQLLTMD